MPHRSASSPLRPLAGKVFQIKIDLDGAEPEVWRRVQVPATMTLGGLHGVIQAAMGWSDDHLHAFTIDRRVFDAPTFDPFGGGDEGPSEESTILLADVLGPRKRFFYEYDFGDCWRHVLKVEKVLTAEPGRTYPTCLEGAGACPPEDCGGVWGYSEKLAILADPEDEDHEDVVDWLGADWDRLAFDVGAANARLAYEA